MKNEPKLQQPDAPLTQLKEIWRRLPELARDYWREQFSSSRPLSSIREEIFSKLKVKLSGDGKLSTFRQWVMEQDARDEEAERQLEDERKIVSDHPEWSLDNVREEVLKRSYFRSLSSGDFKLGLKTVAADMKAKEVTLDRDRFEFDAAKACLKKLPDLQAVADAPKLSPEEKREAIRKILFGG